MRYDRQTILPEIGKDDQQKLKRAKVFIVGMGKLGSSITPHPTGAGVGCIGLVDDDIISISNLQRQALYLERELGRPKAICIIERLSILNSEIAIWTYPIRLAGEDVREIISQYDTIADGYDSFPTRYLINDIRVEMGRVYVYGVICGFEGQVSVLHYGEEKKSYWDLYSDREEARRMLPSPRGVMGITPAVTGNIEATEVLRITCGFGGVLSGKLWTIDLCIL